MHDSEMAAVKAVADVLFEASAAASVTVLHARPYSGVAHSLQRFLADQPRFGTYFKGGILHLHLDAVGSRRDVRRILIQQVLQPDDDKDPLANPVDLSKNLAHHLFAQDRLLIIHGATAIRDDPLINRLAEALTLEANKHPIKVSRLLLTCWSRGAYSHLNNSRPRRVEYDPTINTGPMPYFEEALRYYLELRHSLPNVTETPVDSSVTKLLERHYAAKLDPFTEVPAAVRFRAFCASDIGAPSPFDPTQGIWPRVDEHLAELIPEIAGCLGDVHSDVRTYEPEGHANELTTLRVVSTGLFFFTQAMLTRLQTNAISGSFLADVALDHSDTARNYIHLEPGDLASDGRGYVASMPLLVRSLLQDDWMRWNPASHCDVHQALGETLYEMAEDEDQLALERELPYTPPRGHVRVALALECIRHTMRAARTAAVHLDDRPRAERLTRKALDAYDRFLEADVFQAIDKPTANSPRAATLSRAYGLHGLKFEVLCLLSEDGRGRRPPRGLSGPDAGVFFRELGITLTRMLRPAEALAAFRTALDIPDTSLEERAYVNAHAVAASLVMGDRQLARDFLHAARSTETSASLDDDKKIRMKLRNDAREASIDLADGHADIAVVMWNKLADSGLVPFWGDRIIGYLDANLAATEAIGPAHAAVWRAAEQAANKARNDGLEHERLRVEIRRATICRRLGYPGVAEAILDQVGLDLGRHGGDELVFREFQLESAETLSTLGRAKYAFAAYAYPSFAWLRHGQATAWVERARASCLRLLDQIATSAGEVLPVLEEHPYWKLSESIDRSLAHPFFSVDLLPRTEAVKSTFIALASEETRSEYREKLASVK